LGSKDQSAACLKEQPSTCHKDEVQETFGRDPRVNEILDTVGARLSFAAMIWASRYERVYSTPEIIRK
jgi:hypothetical protein